MKHIIAVAAAIVSLVDVCAGGNAVSAMPESLAADVVPDLTFTQHYGF